MLFYCFIAKLVNKQACEVVMCNIFVKSRKIKVTLRKLYFFILMTKEKKIKFETHFKNVVLDVKVQ